MNESPDQPPEIIVVGTAHISEESIAEVHRTIEENDLTSWRLSWTLDGTRR